MSELEVAIESAEKASKILSSYFETYIESEEKDDESLVSRADHESEAVIIDTIKKAFPEHSILGEESGEEENQSKYKWIIDPLDGTANFLNGIPIFCVSIGLYKDNEPFVGVVANPATNTIFSAQIGKGMHCSGVKMGVSKQEADKGMITFGIGKGSALKERFTKLFVSSQSVFKKRRHLGAVALELAYLARGGIDGIVNLGSELWDHAGGNVLVIEAGGKITDFEGNPWKLGEKFFVASNGSTHDTLLDLVKGTK